MVTTLQFQRPEATRPHLRKVNMVLTILLMIALIKGILPMSVLFMLAFCIAMLINYPDVDMQKKRIAMHADSILAVVGLIFAAGIFTGILSGTGMVEAMSKEFVAMIPTSINISSANYCSGEHAIDVLYVK